MTESQEVKKDDILMELDSAAATLNERQLDYNRMNQLFQIGAISRSYLDTAITALNVAEANSPVILLESKRFYYDIYLSEQQVVNLKPGDSLTGRAVALRNKEVPGTIRFITVAPGFANLKMSREKSSADLSSFQIRIYVQPESSLLPGMTIEVDEHEFSL